MCEPAHVWVVENTIGRVDGIYASKENILSAVVKYYDKVSKNCSIKIDHETDDRFEIKVTYPFSFRGRTTTEEDIVIANRKEVL